MSMQRLDCPGPKPSDQMGEVLDEYATKWQTGMISNAEYLSFLNFAANRSFNDSTQYPIFPWVVADYKNNNFPKETFFV